MSLLPADKEYYYDRHICITDSTCRLLPRTPLGNKKAGFSVDSETGKLAGKTHVYCHDNSKERLAILQLNQQLNFQSYDIGFPAIKENSETAFVQKAVDQIANIPLAQLNRYQVFQEYPTISCIARVVHNDIKLALHALRNAPDREVQLFFPASDLLQDYIAKRDHYWPEGKKISCN